MIWPALIVWTIAAVLYVSGNEVVAFIIAAPTTVFLCLMGILARLLSMGS